MKQFDDEKQLAAIVVGHLRDRGFVVRGEIQNEAMIAPCDIVADSPEGERWMIEVKAALNITVLAQADRWVGYCHRSWIAVPYPVEPIPPWKMQLVDWILKERHIGCLFVQPSGRVHVHINAYRTTSPRSLGLEAFLTPAHETYAEAGSPSARPLNDNSPEKDALVALVDERPYVRVLMKYIKAVTSSPRKQAMLRVWAKKTKRLHVYFSGVWVAEMPPVEHQNISRQEA